jgi:hypothetical protein
MPSRRDTTSKCDSDGQKFLINTQLKTQMTPMSAVLNWTAKLHQ